MSRRVFINGMGRIGRLLVRKVFDAEGEFELVGINDPYMTESSLAYLLNHDTVYGDWHPRGFDASVEGNDNSGKITITGKDIPFYAQFDLEQLPLGDLGVDIVLECTGKFSSNPDIAAGHFISVGARGCLFCYPVSTNNTYVYNVNVASGEKIDVSCPALASAGSASMNAVALLLKAISNGPEITAAFIEEVRSYTGDQNLCDNVTGNKLIERGRAAAQNIVPTTNQDIKRIGHLIPELNGKVLSTALRTPTIVGGAINATIITNTTYTRDEINSAVENKILTDVKGSLAYSTERLVSSDVVSDDSIPIFLSNQTMVNGNTFNVTLLYDNEMGFVNQIINLLLFCYQ